MAVKIVRLLYKLSNLSRETVGASFVIQHSKKNGTWKVSFTSLIGGTPKDSWDMENALLKGIKFLEENRKKESVQKTFTLFK